MAGKSLEISFTFLDRKARQIGESDCLHCLAFPIYSHYGKLSEVMSYRHNNGKMIGEKNQVKSDVLKEARKNLGLSQADVAKMLDSEQAAISKLENGKKIPDWLMKSIILARLLESAGYTFNDLLLSLPDPNSDTSEVQP